VQEVMTFIDTRTVLLLLILSGFIHAHFVWLEGKLYLSEEHLFDNIAHPYAILMLVEFDIRCHFICM